MSFQISSSWCGQGRSRPSSGAREVRADRDGEGLGRRALGRPSDTAPVQAPRPAPAGFPASSGKSCRTLRPAADAPAGGCSSCTLSRARRIRVAAKHPPMKRTYQPKKRKRARTHGFRARMHTRAGRERAEAPPAQGPQAAHPVGSMAERARRKRRRLSRSGEFERVYREGRSHASRHLVVYAFPRADEDARAAAGRLGRAQARRRGRAQPHQAAAARGLLGQRRTSSSPGHDFVIVARPAAGELAPSRAASAAIEEALRERAHRRGALARAGGRRVTALRARRRPRRSALYQRAISPRFPRRCKYHPSARQYAVAGRASLRCAARGRARRLAPAALQPLEPRRRRLRGGPEAVPLPTEPQP